MAGEKTKMDFMSEENTELPDLNNIDFDENIPISNDIDIFEEDTDEFEIKIDTLSDDLVENFDDNSNTLLTSFPMVVFKDENEISHVVVESPVDLEVVKSTFSDDGQSKMEFICSICGKIYKKKSFFVLHEQNCQNKGQGKDVSFGFN